MRDFHTINNLEIDTVEPFVNPKTGVAGFVITWSANIGFGEYTVYCKDGHWYGDSECMDRGDDKGFLTLLLSKFIESIEVLP